MIFDALVLGHIYRNVVTVALAVASVALAVTTIYVERVSDSAARAALRTSVAGFGEAASYSIVGSNGRIGDAWPARLRMMPGLRGVRPVVSGLAMPAGHRDATLRILGIDAVAAFPGSGALRRYEIGAWRPPSAFDRALVSQNGAIVFAKVARAYGLRAGSRFALASHARTVPLTILAVVDQPSVRLDQETVVVDLRTAQRLFAAEGRLDRVDVVSATSPQLEARLNRVVPRGVRVVRIVDRLRELERVGVSFALASSIAGTLAVLVALAVVANAVDVSVRRRHADIATLRALGARRRQIFVAFVNEGLLIGVGGGIVGAIAGDAIARAAGAYAVPDPLLISGDALIGVAIAAVAAILPARRAASLAPVLGWTAVSWRLRAAQGIRLGRLPLVASLALAGVRAHFRRALAIGSIVAISVAFAAFAASVVATFEHSADNAAIRVSSELTRVGTDAAQGDVREASRRNFAASFTSLRSFAAAALLLAVGGTVVALAASSVERSRERALLRVVGVSASNVRSAAVAEAVAIASIGALSGISFGNGLSAAVALDGVERPGWAASFQVPAGTDASVLLIVVMAAAATAYVAAWRGSRDWMRSIARGA